MYQEFVFQIKRKFERFSRWFRKKLLILAVENTCDAPDTVFGVCLRRFFFSSNGKKMLAANYNY